MPIPADFNNNEHLQAVVRRYLNREIREAFRDLNNEDGNWEPSVGTSREQMRWALTHQDNDPMVVTSVRMMLYYFTFGAAKAMQPDIYGASIISQNRVLRANKPQITLYFDNKPYRLNKDDDWVDGEISFRVMDRTYKTLTQADVNRFAARVKNLFATPKFVWRKGKEMASYTDWDNGYQLQLLVTGESEAKRIIEQVLNIQGHTPEWEFLNMNVNQNPGAAYPENPPNEIILGESIEGIRKRPREDVIFRYASMTVKGRGRGINLVDTTFTRANAIERIA